MPRQRKRTINQGAYSEVKLQEAIQKCLDGAKMKPTAIANGIPRATLLRYVNKG